MKKGIIVLLFFVIVGCTHFTRPKDQPIIEDKVGITGSEMVGTLATTADRRTLIVELKNGKFCAEPSPDAMEQVSKKYDSSIEAQVKNAQKLIDKADNELSADVKAKLMVEIQRTIQKLNEKSQGVLWFRDVSYRLCEAYVNGILDRDSYKELLTLAIKEGSKVIENEKLK
jgi:paraquat-inducible protein B